MLHVPVLALDGIVGLNPVRQLRQTIGRAVAQEKLAARLFGNGAMSSGILTFPNSMTNQQKINLKESFEASINTGPSSCLPTASTCR